MGFRNNDHKVEEKDKMNSEDQRCEIVNGEEKEED